MEIISIEMRPTALIAFGGDRFPSVPSLHGLFFFSSAGLSGAQVHELDSQIYDVAENKILPPLLSPAEAPAKYADHCSNLFQLGSICLIHGFLSSAKLSPWGPEPEKISRLFEKRYKAQRQLHPVLCHDRNFAIERQIAGPEVPDRRPPRGRVSSQRGEGKAHRAHEEHQARPPPRGLSRAHWSLRFQASPSIRRGKLMAPR